MRETLIGLASWLLTMQSNYHKNQTPSSNQHWELSKAGRGNWLMKLHPCWTSDMSRTAPEDPHNWLQTFSHSTTFLLC